MPDGKNTISNFAEWLRGHTFAKINGFSGRRSLGPSAESESQEMQFLVTLTHYAEDVCVWKDLAIYGKLWVIRYRASKIFCFRILGLHVPGLITYNITAS